MSNIDKRKKKILFSVEILFVFFVQYKLDVRRIWKLRKNVFMFHQYFSVINNREEASFFLKSEKIQLNFHFSNHKSNFLFECLTHTHTHTHIHTYKHTFKIELKSFNFLYSSSFLVFINMTRIFFFRIFHHHRYHHSSVCLRKWRKIEEVKRKFI
jgi:hypothetical protein